MLSTYHCLLVLDKRNRIKLSLNKTKAILNCFEEEKHDNSWQDKNPNTLDKG